MSLFNFSLDVCLIFIECIEFGNILSEIVVKLGKLDLVDGVELYLEYCSLASELFGMILGGECNAYVELVADVLANDLLLKAGDKLTGAKEKGLLFSCAAVKENTVNRTGIVDDNVVAIVSCSICDLELAGVSLTNHLDLSVNLFVGCLFNFLGNLKTYIVVNCDVRLYENLCRHNETVIVNRNDIELGVAYDIKLGFLNSCTESLGKHLVDSILIEYALAVHSFNYGLGSLTLSKAGYCDVLYHFAVNGIDSLVEGLLVNRELKFISVLFDNLGFC